MPLVLPVSSLNLDLPSSVSLSNVGTAEGAPPNSGHPLARTATAWKG